MAGDWIAWHKGLARKPEVLFVARKARQTRREVAATLAEFWEWADDQTEDGFLPHVSLSDLPGIIPETTQEFWHLVVDVGWLEEKRNGLQIPHFHHWNGDTAKKRLKNTQRQRELRSSATVALLSRFHDDKNGTTATGQNRREENKYSSNSKGDDTAVETEPSAATSQTVAAAEVDELVQQFQTRGLSPDLARPLIESSHASLPQKILDYFDSEARRSRIKKPGGALRSMLRRPVNWGFVKLPDGSWDSPIDKAANGKAAEDRQEKLRRQLEERQAAQQERARIAAERKTRKQPTRGP
jgi:hypothetical protein